MRRTAKIVFSCLCFLLVRPAASFGQDVPKQALGVDLLITNATIVTMDSEEDGELDMEETA